MHVSNKELRIECQHSIVIIECILWSVISAKITRNYDGHVKCLSEGGLFLSEGGLLLSEGGLLAF